MSRPHKTIFLLLFLPVVLFAASPTIEVNDTSPERLLIDITFPDNYIPEQLSALSDSLPAFAELRGLTFLLPENGKYNLTAGVNGQPLSQSVAATLLSINPAGHWREFSFAVLQFDYQALQIDGQSIKNLSIQITFPEISTGRINQISDVEKRFLTPTLNARYAQVFRATEIQTLAKKA